MEKHNILMVHTKYATIKFEIPEDKICIIDSEKLDKDESVSLGKKEDISPEELTNSKIFGIGDVPSDIIYSFKEKKFEEHEYKIFKITSNIFQNNGKKQRIEKIPYGSFFIKNKDDTTFETLHKVEKDYVIRNFKMEVENIKEKSKKEIKKIEENISLVNQIEISDEALEYIKENYNTKLLNIEVLNDATHYYNFETTDIAVPILVKNKIFMWPTAKKIKWSICVQRYENQLIINKPISEEKRSKNEYIHPHISNYGNFCIGTYEGILVDSVMTFEEKLKIIPQLFFDYHAKTPYWRPSILNQTNRFYRENKDKIENKREMLFLLTDISEKLEVDEKHKLEKQWIKFLKTKTPKYITNRFGIKNYSEYIELPNETNEEKAIINKTYSQYNAENVFYINNNNLELSLNNNYFTCL